tara:strand:- start:2140 stop:2991 length:852 start_codon:yes stop_codon:yes gene_type:complete
MSIKQNGGVFGRNPTFNDVTIEGQLTFDGDIDINSDLKIDGNLNVIGNGVIEGDLTLESNKDLFFLATNPNSGSPFQYGEIRFGDSNAGQYVNHAFIKSSGTYASNSTLDFHTSLNNSSPLRMQIAENGNVNVSTGNLVIGTSGKGIDFSATSGTGTSELLSDYEEGSWTSLVGGTATYGANSGRYTKIGRQVMATFDLNITLIGTGSTSTITGLPFATGDSIAEGVSVNFFDGLASSVVELNAYVINSEIRFRSLTAAGTGLSDVAVLGDSCRVTGTAIYTV